MALPDGVVDDLSQCGVQVLLTQKRCRPGFQAEPMKCPIGVSAEQENAGGDFAWHRSLIGRAECVRMLRDIVDGFQATLDVELAIEVRQVILDGLDAEAGSVRNRRVV